MMGLHQQQSLWLQGSSLGGLVLMYQCRVADAEQCAGGMLLV